MNKPVFINLTNHPSKYWGEQQKKEAHNYGAIVDIPFPNVPAEATEDDIRRLCDATVKKVMGYSPEAVLCQGEFTLAFQIINTLLEQDVTVVAACSERVVKENGNRKESYFYFKKFRKFSK